MTNQLIRYNRLLIMTYIDILFVCLVSANGYYDSLLFYPPSISTLYIIIIFAQMQRSNSSSSAWAAVPSRPAPAPPPSGNSHRYTPTTNWDDSPFDAPQSRKVPPPRPPPPRVQPSPIESTWSNGSSASGAKSKGLGAPFKKATPQSVNILSNLFGSRGSNANNAKVANGQGPKLPPPPPALKKHHHHTNVQV